MKTILADKIASVALNNDLHNEVRLSNNIPCEEGVLIAVKILNNNSRYNRLELISGRMSSIQEGDVIVGSLGHRDALLGYSGLPAKSLGSWFHSSDFKYGWGNGYL